MSAKLVLIQLKLIQRVLAGGGVSWLFRITVCVAGHHYGERERVRFLLLREEQPLPRA